MRRWPVFAVVAAVFIGALALRFSTISLALSSATIGLGGGVTVNGTGTPLVTCSISPTSVTVRRPNNVDTILTCRNNSGASMTLNVSGGSWSPANKAPTAVWGTTQLVVPNGGTTTATLTVDSSKNDNAGTFTYTFTISDNTPGAGLDYRRILSVSATLQ